MVNSDKLINALITKGLLYCFALKCLSIFELVFIVSLTDVLSIRSGNRRINLCGISGKGFIENFHSPSVTITLRTDGTVTRKGFLMKWQNRISK